VRHSRPALPSGDMPSPQVSPPNGEPFPEGGRIGFDPCVFRLVHVAVGIAGDGGEQVAGLVAGTGCSCG
jgi:hypothetical protein